VEITRIAIVGLGHRGLSVLDRVLSHASVSRRPVKLLLVEPHELGVGVHWRDQPRYLKLNTVAGQATAFADSRMTPGAPTLGGPTFLEWCVRHEIQVEEMDRAPAPVRAEDYLPRSVWGDYLAWAADHLLARVPPSVEVELKRVEARQVEPDRRGAAIRLADGSSHTVDLAVLATGHGVRRAPPSLDDSGETLTAYPLPATVESIPPCAHVGLAGMGLSAIDVTAALTVGRGGRFAVSSGRVAYSPSGSEPKIVMFSRRGRLSCARPAHPRREPKPGAQHLSDSAISHLRASRPDGRLDFFGDVLPLVRAEVLDRELHGAQRRLAESVLALAPSRFSTRAAYVSAVLAEAQLDLAEAQVGLGRSELKEGLETLRDHRQQLRDVVIEPGLTAEGHRDFFSVLPDLANRAAVGPQIERLQEILALIECGVVELGPGPSPTVRRNIKGWTLLSTHLDRAESVDVDHIVRTHHAWPKSIGGSDPLGVAMRSWAARHPADPRYLHLTTSGHVVTRGGSPANGIVVLGPPAEGASYYNNFILWPRSPSRWLLDVDAVIKPLVG
jgi:hypothetical protein